VNRTETGDAKAKRSIERKSDENGIQDLA